MKNFEALELNKMLATTTCYDLSPETSYQIFAFTRSLGKIVEDLEDQRNELTKKHKVPILEDRNILDADSSEFKKFIKEYQAALDDKAEPKKIVLDSKSFFEFCKENRLPISKVNFLAKFFLKPEVGDSPKDKLSKEDSPKDKLSKGEGSPKEI